MSTGEDRQKSKNPNKNDDEELQSDELQGVPDWLQEFKHGLVYHSLPLSSLTSPTSSSQGTVVVTENPTTEKK